MNTETTERKTYRLYVNEARTLKVEIWPDGAYVADRGHPSDTWSPPERCAEEIHDQTPA